MQGEGMTKENDSNFRGERQPKQEEKWHNYLLENYTYYNRSVLGISECCMRRAYITTVPTYKLAIKYLRKNRE